MTIHFRDGEVYVKKGELVVIPKGIEHKTYANYKSHIDSIAVKKAKEEKSLNWPKRNWLLVAVITWTAGVVVVPIQRLLQPNLPIEQQQSKGQSVIGQDSARNKDTFYLPKK